MHRYAAYIVLGLIGLVAGGSLIAFMAFLFAGSLNLVNLGLDESGVLWLDVGLCLLFFIQHSGMVRRPVRQWLAPFIPEEYGSALYAIASGVVLLIVIVFWQESAQTVLAPRGLFQWPFRALYVLPFVGFVWGTRALGSFDPFGFNPIFHRLRGTYPRPMPFIVRGPYSWVRHPLYLFMVLIIWSCPELTTDRLLFNVLWTAWIVAGLYLEERDLIVEYGDTYREYRRRVPMIIPRRVWPGERTKHRQLRRDLS